MDTDDSLKTAVIVGDNDQPVLQSVSLALGRIGFVVLEASNGSSALDRCRHSRQPVDLAVIDSTLSDMTPKEVTGKLEEICPSVRMLILSDGETEGDIPDATARGHVRRILPKPFRRAQLLGRVLEMMDEPLVLTA